MKENYKFVLATLLDNPKHSGGVRGRVLHLAESVARDSTTLCNRAVDYEATPAQVVKYRVCKTCQEQVAE